MATQIKEDKIGNNNWCNYNFEMENNATPDKNLRSFPLRILLKIYSQ